MPRGKSENSQITVDLLEKVLDSPIVINPALIEESGINVPAYLTSKQSNPKQTTTYRELMVHQLVLKACCGDGSATREVLDRLLGKPSQYTESRVTQTTYIEWMQSCLDADQLEKESDPWELTSQEFKPEKPERRYPPGFNEEQDMRDTIRDLGLDYE